MVLLPVEETILVPMWRMDCHMGPVDSAYTPGLAVRALIVGSGVGILRLFAVGEKDVPTLYGVQEVRHFLNAG